MKRLSILIIVLLLLQGARSAEVPDFSQTLEPLQVISTVVFSPDDRQETPVSFNGTVIYPSTTPQRMWTGSLPLIKGELRPMDKVFKYPPVFNGTVEVEVIELSQEAEVRVNADYALSKETHGSLARLTLLNATVREGDTMSSEFSKTIGFSASDIGNGSYVTHYSYQYLTEFNTNATFFSTIQVMLTVPNDTWNQHAKVKVTVRTNHNPAFNSYMEERYELLNRGTAPASSEADTPFPTAFVPVLLVVTLRRSRRQI